MCCVVVRNKDMGVVGTLATSNLRLGVKNRRPMMLTRSSSVAQERAEKGYMRGSPQLRGPCRRLHAGVISMHGQRLDAAHRVTGKFCHSTHDTLAWAVFRYGSSALRLIVRSRIARGFERLIDDLSDQYHGAEMFWRVEGSGRGTPLARSPRSAFRVPAVRRYCRVNYSLDLTLAKGSGMERSTTLIVRTIQKLFQTIS